MACDRFVYFEKGEVPSRDTVRKIIEDYYGEALLKIEDSGDRLFVQIRGTHSSPLKRVIERYNESDGEERWLEVFFGDDNIDVITRRQDEYTNTLAFGLARLLARYGRGEFEAEGEVPNKPQEWVRPFLWRLWRSGVLELDSCEMQHLLGMFGLEIQELKPLVIKGLIGNDGNNYVLTEKGLSYVCQGETEAWQRKIRRVKLSQPNAKALRAYELRSQNRSLAAVALALGLSRSRADMLVNQHERWLADRKKRDEDVLAFLEGRLAFEHLPVETLGEFSVTVLNGFHNMGVKTVPQLLGLTQRRIIKQKNMGSKCLNLILTRLDEVGETLNPV